MSLVTSRLMHACRRVHVFQSRGMAGGFPADMAVKKNKFIEEWNGTREITTEKFQINFEDVPTLLVWVILFPYAIYTSIRLEFIESGAHRYKDVC